MKYGTQPLHADGSVMMVLQHDYPSAPSTTSQIFYLASLLFLNPLFYKSIRTRYTCWMTMLVGLSLNSNPSWAQFIRDIIDLPPNPRSSCTLDVFSDPARITYSMEREGRASTEQQATISSELRRRTYRAGDATSDDQPPPYKARDPNPLLPNAHVDEGQTDHITQRIRLHNSTIVQAFKEARRDGPKVTAKKVGRSVVKCVGSLGRAAKDMPKVMKGVQQQSRVKRAKSKIVWLEKHDFMSRQDRLLTRELTG